MALCEPKDAYDKAILQGSHIVATKKKKVFLNLNRDINLLCFFWKWKVSTTHAIAGRFFPGVSVRNAYRRLCELADHDFVEYKIDRSGHKFLWTITEKGFETIGPELPRLQESGFGSEHMGHDLLCSAIHLGDFLPNEPDGAELFSERELRSYHESQLPDEFPRRGRRPDGYWYLSYGEKPRTIALEVELNSKTGHDYQTIGYFYDSKKTIDQVIWLMRDQSLAKYIFSTFSKSSLEKRDIHSAILLADFMKLGWGAKVHSGCSVNQTLRSLIIDPNKVGEQVVRDVGKIQGTAGEHVYHRQFLCLSKTHNNSTSYNRYRLGDFS